METRNNLMKFNYIEEAKVITIPTLADLIGVNMEDIFTVIHTGNIPVLVLSGKRLSVFKADNPSFKTNLNKVIMLDYSMCIEIANKFEGRERYFAILDCFFAEEIEGYKLDSLDFDIDSFYYGKALLEDMMKSGKFTRDNRDTIIDIIESNKLGNPSWINDAISLTSIEYHRLYYKYFYIGELLLKQGIVPNKYLIVKTMAEKDFEDAIESKFYVSMLDIVQ